jgi:hypothetical protein
MQYQFHSNYLRLKHQPAQFSILQLQDGVRVSTIEA